jgi:HAE1 family hydrophobic/amphiphilic exporter-1
MTTLVMASLLLAGFFGYRQLPIAAIPRHRSADQSRSACSTPEPVPTRWPSPSLRPWSGSSPTIAGITAITSLSTQGNTQVTLEFDLNRSIEAAALDVQSSISVAMARLPIDPAGPSGLPQSQSGDSPIIFLALTSETAQSQEINEFADKVMSPSCPPLPGRGAGQYPGRPEARRPHQV